MATTTVRIGEETRQVLRDLSARTGQSAREILRQAIEEYRRKRFLQNANAAFAALKRNPKAWEEEKRERKAWESTLSDGIDNR
jgi:predicted DNA-binding protein